MHRLSRPGMPEVKAGSVKRQPANGICSASVNFVADNRVTLIGEVNTNLVFAAGLQPNLDETCLLLAFQHRDVRYGKLSAARIPG